MIPASAWYPTLGEYSFPTVFLKLRREAIAALIAGESEGHVPRAAMHRIQAAIHSLPGAGFVGADVCVPTDSPLFRHGGWVSFGKTAWRQLATSDKVRQAFAAGLTERLVVRPFRRMDRVREFRMFFRGRHLVAMSQLCLERHFRRLARREAEIWELGCQLAERIGPDLPCADLAADVYLCSDGHLLLVDLNAWGAPTAPLLFRTWDRDWESEPGLRLIPPPVKMKGDVSVSF